MRDAYKPERHLLMSETVNVYGPLSVETRPLCEPVCGTEPISASAGDSNALPSGDVGTASDRDRAGRFTRGNRAAVVTGSRSIKFWNAAEAQRDELTAGILADRGYRIDDAPVSLRLAAQGAAQAQIVRDAAFARMIEAGGPLSGSDRERGAHKIWAAASDRLLRHVQTIGYDRAEPKLPSISEYLKKTEVAR